ncbi:MAG TPA: type II toxin-antitoxin system VapB family antitoxin [Actinomycetales bacterium]|nr:type II toxin-antitoxin system VapB family antitoxin [Actinomycetales bacterium]
MALNIKDPETDRLVRELAAVTGESITVATRTAVEERLRRVQRSRERRASRELVMDIVWRARREGSQIDYSRTEDEILGYDHQGIPQ